MNIGIITARGGSKGLPGKNIRELNGTPLIAWSILAAQYSTSIEAIFVSTEDSEIARISSAYGAEIIKRPDELAQDDTGSEPVIQHALEHLLDMGHNIDNVCLLQPTSPLRMSLHIDDSFNCFKSQDAKCVISVFEPHHSAAKAYRLNEDGSISGLLFDDAPYTPRQKLPTTYQPNGAIYWFAARDFMRTGKIPRTDVYPFVMQEAESIDIDTIDDFKKSEALLKARLTQNESSI